VRIWATTVSVSLAVFKRGDELRQRAPMRFRCGLAMALSAVGACVLKSWSQRMIISPIMPARPMRWPSCGL
jgi:hypothetical protein